MTHNELCTFISWFLGIMGVLLITLAAIILPAYLPFAWGLTFVITMIIVYVGIISWAFTKKWY